jgi:hypothetical protein
MPRYKNAGDTIKTYNNVFWKPGEERAVPFFVPDEMGFTKTSDDPPVPPGCLASGILSLEAGEDAEVYIPPCGAFSASFVCTSGSAEIRQNYDSAEAVTISPGVNYEIRYGRPYVERLIVTGVSGASSVVYDIERAE